MRAIVLVKQVPDLRLGGVGVHPDGTIDRGAAPPITNPADLHALEAAVQTVEAAGGGEVWALSMGPKQAEGALRDALAGGAQRGVLLCDHAFAGSDTWATANALAAAVRWLGGADLVLCGLSALDGETGQVGPSIAQRLDWPQVTGCEAMELDGDALLVRRIVEGGYERLRVRMPVVVTVGETGYAPRYPSLPARRRAASATVDVVDAATLGLGPDDVGLAASPTKVAHMAPAPWPERHCRFVGDGFDMDDLVAALVERGVFGGEGRAVDPIDEPSIVAPGDLVEYEGDTALWVVCHTADGALDRASRELLSQATVLAPGLGGGVGALVLAHEAADHVADAGRHGADVVYLAEHPSLAVYRTEPYARVVTEAVRRHRPDAVLLAATTTGRDLAPRVASLLGTGLAADCTDLYVDSWSRHGVVHERLVHMVRPAMAGGVLATCLCPVARPQMATVRPGVFPVRLAPRRARVVPVPVTAAELDDRVEVVERRISPADVDLRDADVVVAGGAGCDATSWHLVEALADAIGGRVAASRGAVEAGLAVRAQQIGQTGATVRRLYCSDHAGVAGNAATVSTVDRCRQKFGSRFSRWDASLFIPLPPSSWDHPLRMVHFFH